MTPLPDSLSDRERRLCKILADYYDASQAGQALGVDELVGRNPDLASALTRFFAEQEQVRQMAGTLDGRPRELLGRTLPSDPTDDGLSSAPTPEDSPIRIGHYELIEELGRGGMGVIFRARQMVLNREVALKVIRAGEFAGAAEIRRFRTEAETVAELDHPHIVPVYEVGEHEGHHFFSMKLLEGGALAAHLDRYQSTPRDAARLVAKLARAMHHAHERGILHRDLKPSNILLDSRGEPSIVDFGLAKRLDAAADLTNSGILVGTPPFFAPEVATGGKGAVTTSTDVYGLGAILYAILTGRPPFEAETVWETIERVKGEPPEPPRRTNPRVDERLETICLKCLKKLPADRYAGARELADDLDRWLDGEPILARPTRWLGRVRLWSRHPSRQRDAGLFGLVLGLLFLAWAILGLVGLGLGWIESRAPGPLMTAIALFIGLAYLPMSFIGWRALQRRPWAFSAGLAHASLFVATNLAYVAGYLEFATRSYLPEWDPATRTMNHALMFTLVFFLLLAYTIGFISHRANPGRSA